MKPLGIALLLVAAALQGCRGDAPVRDQNPEAGFAAVLARGRLILPTGETKSGEIAINLESDVERYRLRFPPGETALYIVEPGTYRLHPTRGPGGGIQPELTVVANRKSYRVLFPRAILRKDSIEIMPRKVVSLGVLEARLAPVTDAARWELSVSLDDRVETQRALVEDMIQKMINPSTPKHIRESAVAWTRSLEEALRLLQGRRTVPPAYKPSE